MASAAQVPDEVAAESEPGNEKDEARYETTAGLPVRLLLGEQVAGHGHFAGVFIERSTCGTARSPSSVISHSCAGEAPAIPANNIVGNVCCAVLYCVAVSL